MCVKMSKQIYLVVLLLIVFTIESEAKYGCPPMDLLKNCKNRCRCTSSWISADYNYRTVFKCDGYSGSVQDLGECLQNSLDGYKIDDFILNNHKSERLPDEAFINTRVKRIIISNSPVLQNFGYSGSGKTIFDGLGQHLETLIITNTPNIRVEEWKNLANSLAGPLMRNSSANPPVLKNLIVYRNSGTTLIGTPSGGLSDLMTLTNLRSIILRSSGLTSFLDSSFAAPDLTPFTKLHLLDLSENKLKEFDAELPPGLTIYLNKNRDFIKFGTGFFDKANSSDISYINLRDANKLDCDCEKSGLSSVVGTQLGQRFDGTCATPSQARGKRYLTFCYNPGYGLIDGSNKHLLNSETKNKLA